MHRYYSDNVRSYKSGHMLILEILEDNEWKTYWSTDEMSNDYAYSELRQLAMSVVEKIKLSA